jgi:hypothetical protein
MKTRPLNPPAWDLGGEKEGRHTGLPQQDYKFLIFAKLSIYILR